MMPRLSLPSLFGRRTTAAALGVALAAAGAAALPTPAMASHSETSIFEDFSDVSTPAQTLEQWRALGATTVRVLLPWAPLAPHARSKKKPSVNLSDPTSYSGWGPYDAIVREAAARGMGVDMTVSGGAPRWAEPQAAPPTPHLNPQYVAWKPNAADYGQFMRAVATRYNGHFTPAGDSSPLPAVHFWAIWNEPNFGQDLAPQATNGSSRPAAPMYYRSLVNQGWRALQATGHNRDTILTGEIAPYGSEPHAPTRLWPQGLPGNFAMTRALLFVRDVYCVDSRFRQLRGRAAAAAGCPRTAAASRRFRNQNPGLFRTTGFAVHPYDKTSPVDRRGQQVDFATFPELGNLEHTLDKVNSAYGSRRRLPIYSTEYGIITNPPVPNQGYTSPGNAAYWLNWSEYLSWRNGRVASFTQYLLQDPPQLKKGTYTEFGSGLEYPNGKPKPTYDAYRLAVYMPRTKLGRSTNAEVWGNARPAPLLYKDGDGSQFVSIQLNGRTIRTQRVNDGFFDIHMRFPHSGTVRLAYQYPQHDSFLRLTDLGKTVYSRSFRVTVR